MTRGQLISVVVENLDVGKELMGMLPCMIGELEWRLHDVPPEIAGNLLEDSRVKLEGAWATTKDDMEQQLANRLNEPDITDDMLAEYVKLVTNPVFKTIGNAVNDNKNDLAGLLSLHMLPVLNEIHRNLESLGY